jgi:hypothetical protein
MFAGLLAAERDRVWIMRQPCGAVGEQQGIEVGLRIAGQDRLVVLLDSRVNAGAEDQSRRHTLFRQAIHVPELVLERACPERRDG